MKKVRKGKKMLILISIAIILIIVATLIIIKVVHKKGKTPSSKSCLFSLFNKFNGA